MNLWEDEELLKKYAPALLGDTAFKTELYNTTADAGFNPNVALTTAPAAGKSPWESEMMRRFSLTGDDGVPEVSLDAPMRQAGTKSPYDSLNSIVDLDAVTKQMEAERQPDAVSTTAQSEEKKPSMWSKVGNFLKEALPVALMVSGAGFAPKLAIGAAMANYNNAKQAQAQNEFENQLERDKFKLLTDQFGETKSQNEYTRLNDDRTQAWNEYKHHVDRADKKAADEVAAQQWQMLNTSKVTPELADLLPPDSIYRGYSGKTVSADTMKLIQQEAETYQQAQKDLQSVQGSLSTVEQIIAAIPDSNPSKACLQGKLSKVKTPAELEVVRKEAEGYIPKPLTPLQRAQAKYYEAQAYKALHPISKSSDNYSSFWSGFGFNSAKDASAWATNIEKAYAIEAKNNGGRLDRRNRWTFPTGKPMSNINNWIKQRYGENTLRKYKAVKTGEPAYLDTSRSLIGIMTPGLIQNEWDLAADQLVTQFRSFAKAKKYAISTNKDKRLIAALDRRERILQQHKK
jgi:hypothetical protein